MNNSKGQADLYLFGEIPEPNPTPLNTADELQASKDLIGEIMSDPERAARISKKGEQLRVMITLKSLREGLGVSQETLAAELGLSQPRVSHTESATDLRLSTLKNYVTGLGCQMKITITKDEKEFELG